MNTALVPPLALLTSVLTLTLSHGLMVVLLPVHLSVKGVETDAIGLVLSLYAVGMLLGGLYNSRLLQRAGHIRLFACAAALVAVSILACALSANPIVWGLMRLLNGFALSVGLAVIDNWLSESATRETRGQLLGANQMVITGGMFVGQFMFNLAPPESTTLFIAGGLLACLALVPIVLSRRTGPVISADVSMSLRDAYGKSQLGMVGCFCSGLLLWSILGMLPIYGAQKSLGGFELTLLSGAAILGSFVIQYPVGYLSDRYDRRTITAWLVVAAIASSAATPLALSVHLWLALPLIALSAGVYSVLYAISISQTFDSLRQSEMAAAMGPLVMVYAMGAIVGPLVSSNTMKLFGPDALFYLLCGFQVLLLAFIVYRISQREALPVEQQESLVPQSSFGSANIELDPRIDFNEAEQPLSRGADLAVILALREPSTAIVMAADVVDSNPGDLLPVTFAMAQIQGVDSQELFRVMCELVPERRTEIAETIAQAWPEGVTDIVAWLLEDDGEQTHQAIASMAQTVPESGSEIIGAAFEHMAESDAQPEELQEFVEAYAESVAEHVESLRPADREDDSSQEQLAEVYTLAAEAMPEQTLELAQSLTEAVPTAAAEVTDAFVQVVTGDDPSEDDYYDEQASEAITQHMSHLAEALPEQFEEIAASVVEAVPEAAADMIDVMRDWQAPGDDDAEPTQP